MARECRIRCHAKPALFDDEFVVRFTVAGPGGPREVCCFAYGDSVEALGKPDESGEYPAALHAYRIGEAKDLVAVVLPQSTFQNGESVLVENSQLVAG